MTPGDRFWMVWRDGGTAPTAKHASRSTAFTEANRLAKVHPGVRFVVLEANADANGTIKVDGRTHETHHPWTAATASLALEPKAPLDCMPGRIHLPPAPATFHPALGDPRPGAAYDCPVAPATGYDYHGTDVGPPL